MKQLLKENRSFLIVWALLAAASIVFMGLTPRIELHLMLNSHHSPALDTFFRAYTHVGGNIPWIVCVIMLIVKMWKGLILSIAQLLATIIVQPLKHIFHNPRPLTVFSEANIDFPVVDGVHLHTWNSFPSGHTAAIFALMFGIAVLLPKWWQKLLCLLVALLGGFSRIYLSQHFLDDVTAGSVVGIVSVLIAMIFFKTDNLYGNKKQEIQ